MSAVFDATNAAKAAEIVDRYPDPHSAILPLAHLAQDQDGYLTVEAMAEIAVSATRPPPTSRACAASTRCSSARPAASTS